MQRELSWSPMKSQRSAWLRSMFRGLHWPVSRSRSTFALAPFAVTRIVRAWQVLTCAFPSPESFRATVAFPFLFSFTFFGFANESYAGSSKVLEASFRVTFLPFLPFFAFLPLTLTLTPLLRMSFWLLPLIFSETFFFAATGLPSASADEARVAQSATASRAASSRDILIKMILSSIAFGHRRRPRSRRAAGRYHRPPRAGAGSRGRERGRP